ncbi:MAG: cell division protein ZapE [Lysobacterales bacterium]
MPESPSARYRAGVSAGSWQSDPAQESVLPLMDRVAGAVEVEPASGLLARWLGRAPQAPQGLYLWGGVGRGKTFLMDLLCASLPPALLLRRHFHRLMGEVHAELARLGNVRSPLAVVASRFAEGRRLLALDEFVVSDIGDAMILAEFLKQMHARGVGLVTTSNIAPRDLYRDGLQRARFMPAIALIERHCVVHELAGRQDYRLRALTRSPVYCVPADAQSDSALAAMFTDVASGPIERDGTEDVNGRAIPFVMRSGGEIWFAFAALCEGPRAVADYIEIARDFHTVMIAGVPRFDGGNDDPARRFMHLIDELYDRNVNLVVSAAAEPLALYSGERLRREFERTASRLIEMQSTDFLAREHRP